METNLPDFINFFKTYPLDIISFIWFAFCWLGYTTFARKSAKRTDCLASILYRYRKEWIHKLSTNGMSEVDAELLSSIEKQVSFFASTTLLILAALATVVGTTAGESFMSFSELPLIAETTIAMVRLKLVLLLVIFVYALFTFTWSMRQYGFCFILFGSSFKTVRYYKESDDFSPLAAGRNSKAMAKVIDRAAHSYNYGLRAYYFALAVAAWFIAPWAFMLAVSLITYELYKREFRSPTLTALLDSHNPITATAQDTVEK